MSMKRVRKNGVEISSFTLGTVQLGMPYGISNRAGKPEVEDSLNLLRTAWEGGVRSFDTAAEYGSSEQVLGACFGGNADALIVTKYHLAPDKRLSRQELIDDVRASVRKSLGHLQRDTIPVLLLHSTQLLDDSGEAVTEAFDRMKQEGLIGKAGISLRENSAEEVDRVTPFLANPLYEAVQLPMNVFDHKLVRSGFLRRLQETGKLVFARSVFLQGLFFLKDEDVPEHLAEAVGLLRKLRELADRYELSLPQLAVSFVRDIPEIDSVVIGAETAEQVRSNIALLEGPPLPESLREQLMLHFAELPEYLIIPRLWSARKAGLV